MTNSERFLADIDAFLAAANMKPSVFGMAAMNDPSFIDSLRSGRQPTLRVVDKVYDFMSKKMQEPS